MQLSWCIQHNLSFTRKKPQHLGWVTPLKGSNSVNPLQLYCCAQSWCEVFERSQYFSSNLRRISEIARKVMPSFKEQFSELSFQAGGEKRL